MSGIVAARADIATHLSNAAGVTGHETRPSVEEAGDAWPLWRGLQRTPGVHPFALYDSSWTVMVALPQDETAATAWLDDHLDGIMEALQSAGYPDSAEVSGRPSGAGAMIYLQIHLRRD